MKYYISDTHFGHENVIEFDNRPFANLEEMENTIINNWNRKVKDDDEVYFLGDLCFRSKMSPVNYLRRLKGKKYLILGNHDMATIMKNDQAKAMFESISQILVVEDGGEQIVLCHFCMASWWHKEKGVLHFYGHIHNSKEDILRTMINLGNAYNVGCMINNYEPCTKEEIIENNMKFWKETFKNESR